MKDLTVGNESKLIFMFTMPMLLGNLFQQSYIIIDSIIVGNFIGKEALAAVGASFPIIFVLISLVIGISMGSTIIISQYFGAKDIKNIKRTIDTLNIFLFFASIFLSIVGIIFCEKIFNLLDIPKDVLPMAKLYLNIYFAGFIFIFGFYGVSAILRGLGDSKTPLYFQIIATVLNVVLDFIFIVWLKWGIAGAPLATIISQGLAFITAVIYLNKTHKIIHFSLKALEFDKTIFYKSIKIGLPTGFQHAFVGMGMMALVRIVNIFGTNALAAYTVAGRIDSFATLPAMNFSMALTTFTGQNIGANKLERVKKGLVTTLIMTSFVSVIVSAAAIIFRYNLMAIFSTDPNVIEIGAEYLFIAGAFYIIFSCMFALNGMFRGAGDTLTPMFISLFALWIIRVPISYFLSHKIGIQGIWWGIPAAWFIGLILSVLYYFFGKWKSKTVI